MAITIYFKCKFREIPSIAYKVRADDRKKSLKIWQSKGNSSSVSYDTVMNFHMHKHVIDIRYKFHKMPSLVTKLWLRMEKTLKFRQSNSNNSSNKNFTCITTLWSYTGIFRISFKKFHPLVT